MGGEKGYNMKVEILGNHISTVDWHGRVSYVLFLNGCRMNCWYCQNKNKPVKIVDHREIADDIKEHMNIIDAVVFSGGEPLLNTYEISRILKELRGAGLEYAVETSGYNARAFYGIQRDIDQVFWDIKADLTDPADWRLRVVPKVAYSQAREFLDILKESGKKVEYRFTIYKGYDFNKILNSINLLHMTMEGPIVVRLQRCITKGKVNEIPRKEIIDFKTKISGLYGNEVVIYA